MAIQVAMRFYENRIAIDSFFSDVNRDDICFKKKLLHLTERYQILEGENSEYLQEHRSITIRRVKAALIEISHVTARVQTYTPWSLKFMTESSEINGSKDKISNSQKVLHQKRAEEKTCKDNMRHPRSF
ncbi:Uncharacterized protein Rs2_10089 [Raphanus sativus]|nr:Uncharacterized protein Rs2_10089 [Raphanus sativus]